MLKAVPLFSGLNRSVMQKFAESLHVRSYRRDEYLYRERDPGLGMYIIQTGRIRLVVEDEDGQLHEVKQISDYDVMGEYALLGDYRRLESAQAVTETTVLGFFRPELKSMLKRDPKTAALLLSSLADYTSDQYMRLASFLIEKEGKMNARRILDVAQSRVTPSQNTSYFVVRS